MYNINFVTVLNGNIEKSMDKRIMKSISERKGKEVFYEFIDGTGQHTIKNYKGENGRKSGETTK